MRDKSNLGRWLLCVLFLTWPAQAQYGGGTGEPNDPYLIYTTEQMNEIGLHQEDWDKQFKLMADIDLSGYTGTDFNIIGNGMLPAFTGVFDGNYHTISNFTYASTGEPCVGIFGYIYGPNARISNVGLIDPDVNGGTGSGVGPLAGWIDMGTVTNCYVTGGNVTGKQQVGGLIGTCAVITDCYAMGGHVKAEGSAGGLIGSCSGSMIDCYATGNVTGSHRIGGLAGTNSGSIIDCYSHGSVDGRDAVGGFVGKNNKGIVTNCFSTTSVTGKNSTGGLVGENKGSVINCYCSCTLDAQDRAGGLVGINDGIITASYSSAGINGRDEIGGLVGYNTYDAEIVNCYTNGDVIGRNYVGGLVGNNATVIPRPGLVLPGAIRNCYSVTLVSGGQNVGGLIGHFGDDGVSASFWDIEASRQATSDGGVGKTTLEMQDPNTFIDAGWDFAGAPGEPGNIWAEPEGGGYPVLWWQVSPLPELPAFSGGSGEPDNPYLVSTADELNSIGHNPRLMTSHFKLVNDIDLTGVDFYIIASQYYPFRGTFDGNDHTISNFSYTSPEATGAGFFGYVSNGRIKNLGLIAPNVHVDKGEFHGCLVGLLAAGIVTNCYVESGSITGQDELGGLVGENGSGGVIMNCYFTGEATGKENVGGLVGQNHGSITASYSYADVEGRIAVGGLVGRCSPGETVNCYARGNVIGQWYVGGLVGTNGSGTHSRTGAIRNCYSASTTLMGSQKGGLLGADWGGEVRDSFWDIETSGQTTSHGGEGKTTAEMQSGGTFLDAGWDFAGETANGTGDIWWILAGQSYPRLWWQYGWAFSPYPQNGAVNVPQSLTLSWLPGESGLYHDVYFGEDKESVANATIENSNIYRGRQKPEITTYNPGNLELVKTYYWRIDEVKQADPHNPWNGKLWSFTTADFIVVDDFESYNVIDPIWWAWKDGIGYFFDPMEGPYLGNGTGSVVGDINGLPEQTIVHRGKQSMPYLYNNDKQSYAYYSEAEKTLSYPRDWTEEGVSELSLWFYGIPTNDPEPMYVAITNRTGTHAVIYHDDPNVVRIDTWTEWIIPLQTFADQGIDLTDIDRIAIGIGTRGNREIPGGQGKMYFDDIRLYRPRPAASNDFEVNVP